MICFLRFLLAREQPVNGFRIESMPLKFFLSTAPVPYIILRDQENPRLVQTQRVLVSFQFDDGESVIKPRQIGNANLIAVLLNLRCLNLNRAHGGSTYGYELVSAVL